MEHPPPPDENSWIRACERWHCCVLSVMNYYTSIKFEYCNVAERHTLKPATACMFIRNPETKKLLYKDLKL